MVETGTTAQVSITLMVYLRTNFVSICKQLALQEDL